MAQILLLGAAGFIGGAVLESIAAEHGAANITGLVRSESKGKLLQQKFPGLKIALASLDDTDVIEKLAYESDIVIHIADADHEPSVRAILKGLGKREKTSSFIHTSGIASLVALKENVPSKVWDDVNDIDVITSLPGGAMHKEVDDIVLQGMEASGGKIRTLLISPPYVTGVSSSPTNKTTPAFKWILPAMIKHGSVFLIGDGNAVIAAIDVLDIADFYRIVLRETLKPNGGALVWGSKGYYFVSGGDVGWRDILPACAKVLAKAGLLKTSEVASISAEEAAKLHPYVPLILGSTIRCRSTQAKALGWVPKKTNAGLVKAFADAAESYAEEEKAGN